MSEREREPIMEDKRNNNLCKDLIEGCSNCITSLMYEYVAKNTYEALLNVYRT